ncbi:MAG: glycerol kinase GlpK [Bacillota bacterium]
MLALDQGTTSSRAIVFDLDGRVVGLGQREFTQHYPRPGWVEHDPLELWETQLVSAREAVETAGISWGQVAAIGITNQRETTVVWDRVTGAPVAPAIVWQCRRTAPLCDQLTAEGWAERVSERTGLVIDAYFSGTKLAWILEHTPDARARAERGELCFGTIDTWLIWKLTGGRVHATDPSNASRTMLYNIHTANWDDELLARLAIPRQILPQVRPSAGHFGQTADCLPVSLPITGVAGDQQAALFGHGCLKPGMAKNTYGTGCFLLMHTGHQPFRSASGLLTTIAWDLGDGPEYALEGSIFIGGAVIGWLRDALGLIPDSAASQALAESVPDNGGVYLVPAFAGLGAPYWDMYARGLIIGLTRGTGRAHLARAALEAIAYQTRDVLAAMQNDAGVPLNTLMVDGGATANHFLMQFQADILGCRVQRPALAEVTALGAANLAAVGLGLRSREELGQTRSSADVFAPRMERATADNLYRNWQRAVERSRTWER